jgi:hypothetical protein
MKCVFFRCCDGHFYRGASCPFDGWASRKFIDIDSAVRENPALSLADIASMFVMQPGELNDVYLVECTEMEAQGFTLGVLSLPDRTDFFNHAGKRVVSPLFREMRKAEREHGDGSS